MRTFCVLVAGLMAAGCGSSDDSGGGSGNVHATLAGQCVDRINQFRAGEGLAPYARWTDQESCANGQAKSDSETKTAHGAFGDCTENAQNECPGYPSEDAVLGTCLNQMWAEGPGADFQEPRPLHQHVEHQVHQGRVRLLRDFGRRRVGGAGLSLSSAGGPAPV